MSIISGLIVYMLMKMKINFKKLTHLGDQTVNMRVVYKSTVKDLSPYILIWLFQVGNLEDMWVSMKIFNAMK